jgi:hypothetical protein
MQTNGKKSKPQAKLMKKRKSAMLPEVCLISRLSVRVFGALCVCVCVREPAIFHPRHASLMPFFFVSFSGVWDLSPCVYGTAVWDPQHRPLQIVMFAAETGCKIASVHVEISE